MEFAAIQCQVHFEDFQEEKHKPGFIENLSEYLPEQYANSWGAEKKILRLYSKHCGLSPLEAKHLYTKTARDLPTYGVTFFLVKEKQKGKKKLVPRLLGINSEAILRLDEVSKEILQTWPLTQVKTYRAHKNDVFTLDFGDYSEKEYSVKTNEALRIRDILEGYIDIIRRRQSRPATDHTEHSGVLYGDHVEASSGNIITHVVNTPSKVVETSYVGPSKLLPYEQGSKVTEGTQVMTVQQVVITGKGGVEEKRLIREVPMRSDMSLDLVKKLNRMNSNAVKIVTLLSDPTEDNIKQVQEILNSMGQDMPVIQSGVKEAAEKEKSEEEKAKLLAELDELSQLFATASEAVKSDKVDIPRLEDDARRIADLTTQMYFSLDPATRRRSKIIRRSRQSFIEEEKEDSSRRRASFVSASAAAALAVDTATHTLQAAYEGGALRPEELSEKECSAFDKLGRINAAVATFLTAHSDPQNVDYSAAVNSMNTIKELLPELAIDAKALSENKDETYRRQLLDYVTALCDVTRRVCMLSGCSDRQKLQEATTNYADASGKLVYIFGARNPRVNADKENQILDAAKAVGDATAALLMRVEGMMEGAAGGEGGAGGEGEVEGAGAACADAARDLLVCAMVTAPSISSPQCRGALSAGAGALSIAAQRLAAAAHPRAPSQSLDCHLTNDTIELAKALDCLKSCYSDLDNDVDESLEEGIHSLPEWKMRLSFVDTVHGAKDCIQSAADNVDSEISPTVLSDEKMNELLEDISQKMAQINSAVASLLKAKSDPHPDYETAALAVETISRVLPSVVQDCKEVIFSCQDEPARRMMSRDVRKWCDGINGLIAASSWDDRKYVKSEIEAAGDKFEKLLQDGRQDSRRRLLSVSDCEGLDVAVANFAEASKKLSFVFSHRGRKAREQLMTELFESAYSRALKMVDDTNKMADSAGGAGGERLRALADSVAHSANSLRTTFLVTAPTLDSPRCLSALASDSENLSLATTRLVDEAASLQDDETGCSILLDKLQKQRAALQKNAARLQEALADIKETLVELQDGEELPRPASQCLRRLQLMGSSGAALEKAQAAHDVIHQLEDHPDVKLSADKSKELQDNLSRDLAETKSAVAALIIAKTDPNNPNYAAAEEALQTISQLVPDILKDASTLISQHSDEANSSRILDAVDTWSRHIWGVLGSAVSSDVNDFVDKAQKFADSTNKLIFVFSPHELPEAGKQIMQLSSEACSTANQMADAAVATCATVSPRQASEVRARGRRVRAGARALHTTTQLTAPSIHVPENQASIVSCCQSLSSSAAELVSVAPSVKPYQIQLHDKLADIQTACEYLGEGELAPIISKENRLRFITSASTVQNKIKENQKLLEKPSEAKLNDQETKDLQEKLSSVMAEVNAALSDLINAKSDARNPDYVTAERSFEKVSQLMPEMINDARDLSTTCKDDSTRRAMLEELQGWWDAIHTVCASASNDDPKKLNEAALKLSNASQKLRFVFSARTNPVKVQQIMQLSSSACDKANQLAEETKRVAKEISEEEGVEAERETAMLLRLATSLADASDALHATVQLTAPCMTVTGCGAGVVRGAGAVCGRARSLRRVTSRSYHHRSRALGEEAGRYTELLDRAYEALKAAIESEAKQLKKRVPPPVPVKRSSLSNSKTPQAPGGGAARGGAGRGDAGRGGRVRAVSHSDGKGASQDWIEHMRRDSQREREGLPTKSDPEALRAKEERRLQEEFMKAVHSAKKKLHDAEKELEKVCNKKASPSLDSDQAEAVKERMEHNLAGSAVTAAKLVAGYQNPEEFDYASVQASTEALSEFVADIVRDAVVLSNMLDDNSRQYLQNQALALCAATSTLLGFDKADNEKLIYGAMAFGDKSAELLYAVNTEIDPAQEREVISRAKAIGDSAGRVAQSGAGLARGAGAGGLGGVCAATRGAALTAGTFVYTAKLVAPSVHHQLSQNALITASHELSDRMKTYSHAWKPLASDPKLSAQIAAMITEAGQLETLLEDFRRDLAAGRLVRRMPVETIVVEDTPLRHLASEIMGAVRTRAESQMPEDKKKPLLGYGRQLHDAITALDLATYTNKTEPFDMRLRQEFENAIQTLQVTVLQSRPSLDGKPRNNIVDLTDFIKDTSKEAENFYKILNKLEPTLEIEKMKDECDKIKLGADKLLDPMNRQPDDDTSFDGILEVDQFGQDCNDHLKNIKIAAENIKDKKVFDKLQENSLRLEESCNLLRFATKSALATAQCASLDETLEDLNSLEPRIDAMLAPIDGAQRSEQTKRSTTRILASRSRLTSAAARVSRGLTGGGSDVTDDVTSCLLAYVTDARATSDLCDAAQRNKLKDHISKVLNLLKTVCVKSSARVALWQPLPGADTIQTTDELIQELENPPFDNERKENVESVLKEIDLNQLLIPGDQRIKGNAKQVQAKLQECATKLVCLVGTVQSSADSALSLSRAVRPTLSAATLLAAAARSLPAMGPGQKKRTEEACDEMCWATYNLLKTADWVTRGGGQGSPAAKVELGVAARRLTDAINRLARSSDGGGVSSACGSALRALQAHAQPPAPPARAGPPAPPTAAALPYDTCLQALSSQQEYIQKLNNDEPMPREQFTESLNYITSAICNSANYATQCAYLLSISEEHKDMAREGLVNVPRLRKLTAAVEDLCHRIMRTQDLELVKAAEPDLLRSIQELQQALKEGSGVARDAAARRDLTETAFRADLAGKAISTAIAENKMDKVTTHTITLLDSLAALSDILERPSLVPTVGNLSPETKAMRDNVTAASSNLISKTQALVTEVTKAAENDDDGPMTWVTFNTPRRHLLDAFEALLTTVKQNGEKAGLVEITAEIEEEPEVPMQSYVETLEGRARVWLQRRPSSSDVQTDGEEAATLLIDLADHMTQDTKDQESEDLNNLITESRELLTECSKKYDNDTASALMECLRELRKAIQRGAVTRVVEDFLTAEEPLQDIEPLLREEKEEAKRKSILAQKIAELMDQLARVRRTARLVASAGVNTPDTSLDQMELLAPKLVKAAEEAANSSDAAAGDRFRQLLAQYAAAVRGVQVSWDRALDPLAFTQAAGDTMAKMRESLSQQDPKTCAYTSRAITRLCARVIGVGMSSRAARADPELRAALATAQDKLASAAPAQQGQEHWKDTTAEILRTTGEVESALGGENIFKKSPEPNQPIYNAALTLHRAVRGWSARDNEIVAVAKRMAVLMARLSDQMNTDRKRELIATSKAIVAESREVAALAKKMALECADVRIRTNLLQVCERIPTISGQLKMLTVVKGSSLGNQGGEEDREAMNMLVVNAQNLMSNVQEVVKAAASASVKIASQRGLKWVRKNY